MQQNIHIYAIPSELHQHNCTPTQLLQQDLNNIRQKDMVVTNYTTKIKEICDVLGSINVTVEEDEMVQIYLGGLAHRYGRQRYAPGRSHRLLQLAIDVDGRRKQPE